MKIFFPRHIEWGFFNVNFQIWPLSVSMTQFMLIAGWVSISFSIAFSLINKWFDRAVAMIIASPVLLMFLFIAFFKFSELSLIPFISKLIRTYFIDSTQKFQVNYAKPDQLKVSLLYLKWSETKQMVQTKDRNFDKEKVKKLKQDSFFKKSS